MLLTFHCMYCNNCVEVFNLSLYDCCFAKLPSCLLFQLEFKERVEHEQDMYLLMYQKGKRSADFERQDTVIPCHNIDPPDDNLGGRQFSP